MGDHLVVALRANIPLHGHALHITDDQNDACKLMHGHSLIEWPGLTRQRIMNLGTGEFQIPSEASGLRLLVSAVESDLLDGFAGKTYQPVL